MAFSLLLGLVVLALVMYFLNWYGKAKTEDVKKSLRWVGVGVGLLLFAFLALTGRLGLALGFLMGLMAWIVRVFSMIQMGRQFSGMFRGFAKNMTGAKGPNTSQVEASFLRMTLDHDTGHLDGEVTKGAFTGRKLSALSFDDLMALHAEARGDAESAALLESFLDRAHADWRARGSETAAAPPPAASGAMTRDEALQILGLPHDAKPDDIKAAYRRLMTQLHPDKGGTDYFAAKINAAKDLLLKD